MSRVYNYLMVSLMLIGISCEQTYNSRSSAGADNSMKPGMPEWKVQKVELGEQLRKQYQAESVSISSRYRKIANEREDHWLTVDLLNPVIEDVHFDSLSKRIAIYTLEHLLNHDKFEAIEVSITQRKGFVLTFTSSRNVYYKIDSLLVFR